ncbi:MAG: hypothetical protein RL687_3 [Candidatus Parcubacteria bacterium]|jgi:hypothetical protein
MDQDIKKLLEENLELSKENNELLKKVRNTQKLAQIYRIVYWVVIIGASYGAYYFVQPYIGGILNVYGGGGLESLGGENMNGVPDLKSLQGLLESLNK